MGVVLTKDGVYMDGDEDGTEEDLAIMVRSLQAMLSDVVSLRQKKREREFLGLVKQNLKQARDLVDAFYFDHFAFYYELYPSQAYLAQLKGVQTDIKRLGELFDSKYEENVENVSEFLDGIMKPDPDVVDSRDRKTQLKTQIGGLKRGLEEMLLVCNDYIFLLNKPEMVKSMA